VLGLVRRRGERWLLKKQEISVTTMGRVLLREEKKKREEGECPFSQISLAPGN